MTLIMLNRHDLLLFLENTVMYINISYKEGYTSLQVMYNISIKI